MAGGTAPSREPPRWAAFDRVLRRGVVTALTLVVVIAALGGLGVRTGVATQRSADVAVRIEYPRIARPGLAVPLRVAVTAVGGHPLASPLEVAITGSYLEMFDENGLSPQPTSESTRADDVVWTFDVPPDQHRFVVSFDARIEPGVQGPRRGRVAVTRARSPAVQLAVSSWILP